MSISRRALLRGGLLIAPAALLPAVPMPASATTTTARGSRSYPFSLGVASGDPLPDGVVLWTRLALDPLALDGRGGMPDKPVSVSWQVATDERFGDVVRAGSVRADPSSAHSVHVEVGGLAPDRVYFYRFRSGTEVSPVGRTRTAPAFSARLSSLAFGVASCQNYADGYYNAYRDMADADLDFVVFLGDYIYEGPGQGTLGRGHLPGKEITTLADYRVRHAQYRGDPDLQAAHAAFPWLVTWDDHEVDNNYSATDADPNMPLDAFLARRAAAYQAYWEHQPLRRSSVPRGPSADLYRRYAFGDLAEISMLDTRQYRDDQINCSGEQMVDGYCPSALDPSRSILGEAQKAWLFDGFSRTSRRWNALAQQVLFAQKDNDPSLETKNYVGGGDQWDGYKADRDEVLQALATSKPSNPVVLTGDWHRNAVYDLKADFANPDSPTVGTEFVGTSISSAGDPVDPGTSYSDPNDPHERFYNLNRGWMRCDVSPAQWQTTFRAVSTVRSRDAQTYPLESFVVEDGRPGAQRV